MVKHKFLHRVAVFLVVALSAAALANQASAQTTDSSDLSTQEVTAAISDAAPVALTGAANVTTDTVGAAAIDTTVSGVAVEVPTNPAAGIQIDPVGATPGIVVGLPSAAEADHAQVVQTGVVAYSNNDGSTTVPVVKDNGSVSINTVISEAAAPETYAYPLTVPDGARLELTTDGGARVVGADGEQVAVVAAAWARDAAGNAVATHFEAEGTTLTQVVEHRADGVQYPVSADPWWGRQFKVSSTTANRIASLLNVGAGISGIAAAICGPVPCSIAWGVAAGIMAIGSGVIGWCNARGRGININVAWSGHVWCTSR